MDRKTFSPCPHCDGRDNDCAGCEVQVLRSSGLTPADLPRAAELLRAEKAREKGCEFCLDDSCPPLDWQYGLDHILPGYGFCPMCGRPLSET